MDKRPLTATSGIDEVDFVGVMPEAVYLDYTDVFPTPRNATPLEAAVAGYFAMYPENVQQWFDMDRNLIHQFIPGLAGIRHHGHSVLARYQDVSSGQVLRTEAQGVEGFRGNGKTLFTNPDGRLWESDGQTRRPVRPSRIPGLMQKLVRLQPVATTASPELLD